MPESTPTGEYEYRPLPVDDIVYRFEKAFRAGAAPRIEDFLCGDGPDRWHLLIELIHSELELRLRAGDRAELAEYLTRYPALAYLPNELAAVLETELRLCAQVGEAPDLKAYEARYPALGSRVREAFRRVGSAPPEVPGYELLEKIAQGGMGVVYKARQVLLRREVALKLIRNDRLDGAAGDRFRARFRREAEAVAAINHPHVVQVFETGESGGDLFIAMELVDGPSLQKRLDAGGVLDPRAAAVLLEKVARAVQAVHERKIVHRDLKPDNILLTASGDPKLADFGLARPAEVSDGGTKAGVVIGTPEYMSPEQASLSGEEPTPAVDVYGLGAVLYACLTGRSPFPRESVQATLEKVRTHAVVAVRDLRPDCPRDLETICLKCLEKPPARRYASAEALADDLRRWLDGRPVVARPVGRGEKARKWVRRNPVVAGLMAAVFGLLVVGTASTYAKYRAELEQKEVARWNAETAQVKTAEAERHAKTAQDKTADAEREAGDRKLAFVGYTLAQAREAWDRGDANQTHELMDTLPDVDRDWVWHLLDNWFQNQAIATRSGPLDVADIVFDTAAKRMYLIGQSTSQVWDTDTWTIVAEELPNKKLPPVNKDPLPDRTKTGYRFVPGVDGTMGNTIVATPTPIGHGSQSSRDSVSPENTCTYIEEPATPGNLPLRRDLKIAQSSVPKNNRFTFSEAPDELRIHDALTNKTTPIRIPESHRGRAIICGSGNRLIIEVEEDNEFLFCCYQLPECKEQFRLKNSMEQSSLLLPSHGGRYLLLSYRSESEEPQRAAAKCLDLQTGTVLYPVEGLDTPDLIENNLARPLAVFAPDDRHFFYVLNNNAIVMMHTESGKEERRLVGHRAPVTHLATTPNGSHLVTVGEVVNVPAPTSDCEDIPPIYPKARPKQPTTIKVWDLRKAESGRGTPRPQQTDRTTRWDFGYDDNFYRFQKQFEGFPKSQPAVAKTVSTGKAYLRSGWVVTGHKDGTVRVWNASDERLLFQVVAAPQPVSDVDLSVDGRRLAAKCEPVRKVVPGEEMKMNEYGIVFPEVITKGQLAVWDVVDLREANLVARRALDGERIRIGLCFSPRGTRLFCGFQPRIPADTWCRFEIWNCQSDQTPIRYSYFSRDGFWLAWNDDESKIAYADESDTILVRQLDRQKEPSRFVGHRDAVTGIAFHPVGPRFVSVGADRSIQVYDPRLKTPLLKLSYRGGVPDGVRFLDGGRVLEVTDRDGGVVLYPTVPKAP